MSFIEPQGSYRRYTVIAAVVVLHAAVLFALANGMGRTLLHNLEKLPKIETLIVTEQVKPELPPVQSPPATPRNVREPTTRIPIPEVSVPRQESPHAITAAPAWQEAASGSATQQVTTTRGDSHVPARITAALVDANACAKPEYPPAALRANESGVVALAFLIEVDGRVVDSRVERSSGFRRLDEAARKALGLCQFRPATLNGVAERSWAKIEYEWRIQ